jgi:hypothetical protein
MHVDGNRISMSFTWDEPSLLGPHLKVARAIELLQALHSEATQFKMSRNLATGAEPRKETDTDGNEWWVVDCASVQEIPIRLALLAGDVVHNARSALDHIAYQLVRLDGGKPDERTATPLRSFEPKKGRSLDSYEAALNGIADKRALTFIASLQPYKPPKTVEREDLALLHELDIIDKHRLIRPGVAHMVEAHGKSVIPSPGIVETGKELFRYPSNMKEVELKTRYEFAFWEQQVDMARIGRLVSTAQGVVQKFVPLFAPEP